MILLSVTLYSICIFEINQQKLVRSAVVQFLKDSRRHTFFAALQAFKLSLFI